MAKKADNPLHFDKRLVDRFLARGEITRDELEGRLQQLPDLAEQAENIADRVFTHTEGKAESATDEAA